MVSTHYLVATKTAPLGDGMAALLSDGMTYCIGWSNNHLNNLHVRISLETNK